MNYCNDCYYFKRTMQNLGLCQDSTKIIYTGTGWTKHSSIEVRSSDHCANWLSRIEAEGSPVFASSPSGGCRKITLHGRDVNGDLVSEELEIPDNGEPVTSHILWPPQKADL